MNPRRISINEVGELSQGNIYNSSPENTLSVVVVAIVADEIGKFEMLGLWIQMPITSFRSELSVKIAGFTKFCAAENALSRERIMHGTVASHGG